LRRDTSDGQHGCQDGEDEVRVSLDPSLDVPSEPRRRGLLPRPDLRWLPASCPPGRRHACIPWSRCGKAAGDRIRGAALRWAAGRAVRSATKPWTGGSAARNPRSST